MPATSSNQPSTTVKKHRSKFDKSVIISVIALMVAIVAIIGVAITWQQTRSIRTAWATRIDPLQQSLLMIKRDLQQFQLQTHATISTNQKNIDHLLERNRTSSTPQAINEAGYLVRLANLHLTAGNHIGLTIELLKMATQRLNTANTAAAIHLKSAISHDIATLSAIPQLDVSDLLRRLDKVSAQISTLPRQPLLTPHTSTMQANTHPTNQHWWDKVKHNLSGLKQLFIVRHFAEPIKPLLLPQQTVYLIANIRQKIAQAQWAVLYNAPVLYQNSLNLAIQWLNQYYPNQAATTHVIKKLRRLAAVNMAPTMPKTLQSISALHDLSSTQQATTPTAAHDATEHMQQ